MEKLVFCLLFCNFYLTATDIVLPSIIWNPWNPVFSCDVTRITVAISNKLNFLCPVSGFQRYTPDHTVLSTLPIYENLYFLDTNRTAFDTCDASKGKRLLTCDDSKFSYYNLKFVKTASDSTSLEFVEGKTYYFIGTGFRTMENIDQTVNGSCNTIDKPGQYKLRLEVYICTKAEVDSNNCSLCSSENCYYKDCQRNCSQWESQSMSSSENTNNCSMIEKRICLNNLLGKVSTEYKQRQMECQKNCSKWEIQSKSATTLDNCTIIEKRLCSNNILGGVTTEYKERTTYCPSNCTAWAEDRSKLYVSKTNCTVIASRTCVNSVLGETKTEIKEISTSCPKPLPTSAPSVGNNESAFKRNMYVAIGATIVFFICGIVGGIFCHQKYHSRSCMNKQRVGIEKEFGMENNGYVHSINTLNKDSTAFPYGKHEKAHLEAGS